MGGADMRCPGGAFVRTLSETFAQTTESVARFLCIIRAGCCRYRSSYEAEVAEDTPVRTTVARVHARDADAGENGHVTYRWAEQTDEAYGSVFGIVAESGEVYLKSPLDYERQQTYKVRTSHTVVFFLLFSYCL